jgi:hypothetical protein
LHPLSFTKAEDATVPYGDRALGISSYISQSASIAIEDGERLQGLRPFVLHSVSLFAFVLSVLSSAARWLPFKSEGTLFLLRSVWSLR